MPSEYFLLSSRIYLLFTPFNSISFWIIRYYLSLIFRIFRIYKLASPYEANLLDSGKFSIPNRISFFVKLNFPLKWSKGLFRMLSK